MGTPAASGAPPSPRVKRCVPPQCPGPALEARAASQVPHAPPAATAAILHPAEQLHPRGNLGLYPGKPTMARSRLPAPAAKPRGHGRAQERQSRGCSSVRHHQYKDTSPAGKPFPISPLTFVHITCNNQRDHVKPSGFRYKFWHRRKTTPCKTGTKPTPPPHPNIIKILSLLIFKRFEVSAAFQLPLSQRPPCPRGPALLRTRGRRTPLGFTTGNTTRVQDRRVGLGGRERAGASTPGPAHQPLLLLGHGPTALPMEGEQEVEELENERR